VNLNGKDKIFTKTEIANSLDLISIYNIKPYLKMSFKYLESLTDRKIKVVGGKVCVLISECSLDDIEDLDTLHLPVKMNVKLNAFTFEEFEKLLEEDDLYVGWGSEEVINLTRIK
jgi:hypothetical protein